MKMLKTTLYLTFLLFIFILGNSFASAAEPTTPEPTAIGESEVSFSIRVTENNIEELGFLVNADQSQLLNYSSSCQNLIEHENQFLTVGQFYDKTITDLDPGTYYYQVCYVTDDDAVNNTYTVNYQTDQMRSFTIEAPNPANICEIDYIEFSPFNEFSISEDPSSYGIWRDNILIENSQINIVVHAVDPLDCALKQVDSVNIVNRNSNVFDLGEYKFNQQGLLSIPVFPGENNCNSSAANFCDYFVKATYDKGGVTEVFSSSSLISGYQAIPDTENKEKKGEISYKRSPQGTKIWEFNRELETQGSCTISEMKFIPSSVDEDSFVNNQGTTVLKIISEGCIGQEIEIQIYDEGNEPDRNAEVNVNGIFSNNIVTVTYIPGDNECDEDEDPDCQFYARLAKPLRGALTDPIPYYSTEDDQMGAAGEIHYNCHLVAGAKVCDKPWQVKTITGLEGQDGQPLVIGVSQNFDQNNPCYRADVNPDIAGAQEGYAPDCYELLAPLPLVPGQEFITVNEQGRQSIETGSFRLGDYINLMFKIALGILVVLAILMIIISGVEYMTVESIYGKSNARNRITNAVTGLLVGFGIFLTLSTINPRITDDVNFAPPSVTINFNSEAGDGFNYNSPPTNYPSLGDIATDGSHRPLGCPQGIVVVEGFYICNSMANNLQNLFDSAAANGFTLSGGGFRSAAQQLWLREQNCQPNPATRPSSDCTPPTARPGRSNHEAGLAVDLRCNSLPMGGACLDWMRDNAGNFGFLNLPSEPWHWSHDGR